MVTIEIQKKVSLKPYNTFDLDVSAEQLVIVKSYEELKSALLYARKEGLTPLFIGGGSNILLCNNLSQLVIINQITGYEIDQQDEHSVALKTYSGHSWHETVMYCIDQNWGGIENLSLIPGSMGAAPMQNIGAYGIELKDVFLRLEAVNLETFEIEVFNKEECHFGYRESVFKRELKGKYFIYSVTLTLKHGRYAINTSYGAIEEELKQNGINSKEATIKEVSDAVIRIRQSKLPDPKVLGNSGSFFKNPIIPRKHFNNLQERFKDIKGYNVPNGIKVPAGWLIESRGWKGKRVGNTGSHAKQALVLVNYGNARGEEVKKLAIDIIEDIRRTFDIQLEPEVNIIS